MTNRLPDIGSIVVIAPLRLRLCWLVLVVPVVLVGLLLPWGTTTAQEQQATPPRALILVAAADLPDPNFARSVVLVTETPVGELIGVILNRPTETPWPNGLRTPERGTGQRIHFGGLLVPAATFSIAATSGVVEDTIDLGEGLRFAVGLRNTLALARAGAPDGALKLFSGYAGWGPGQLQTEIAMGAWQVRPVAAELIFDPEPATQWERLTALQRSVRIPPRGAPLADVRKSRLPDRMATGRVWP